MIECGIYRLLGALVVLGLITVLFLKMFGMHETHFVRDFVCGLLILVLASALWDAGCSDNGEDE